MTEEAVQDATHGMTPEMRYYYRNREEKLAKDKERYNNKSEVIAKREEKERKKAEKEKQKEAKCIEKKRIRQEKLEIAEATKRQFKESQKTG
jgi:hypothetical protein